MEEEKRVQNEFVFVNRNVGFGRSERVEPEEHRIPEKTHSARKPISLEGEAFVAVLMRSSL